MLCDSLPYLCWRAGRRRGCGGGGSIVVFVVGGTRTVCDVFISPYRMLIELMTYELATSVCVSVCVSAFTTHTVW